MWQEIITALIVVGAVVYMAIQIRSRRKRSERAACADGCCGCPHARVDDSEPAGCCGSSAPDSRAARR
jgi:hypothetical protein